jgi:hypothetical protein
VRVVEAGGETDLAEEAVAPDPGGQLGAEDLERHPTVVAEVAGQEDGCHAAATELALDGEAAGDGLLDLPGEIVHGDWDEGALS